MITTIIGNEKAYFRQEYIYQEYLARLVKMNILITEGKNITNTRQQDLYIAPDYDGLLIDRFIKEDYTGPSEKIRKYQKEIREFVRSKVRV